MAAAATVPADLLARYERLRTTLAGTGAARLVGGSCSGCHLTLPAMEVDRIRKAPRRRSHHLRPVRSHPGPVTGTDVLVLVRHGESAANAAGLLSGRAESPLTEQGRTQVAGLSAVVAGAGPLDQQPARAGPGDGRRPRTRATDRGGRALDRDRLRRARRPGR